MQLLLALPSDDPFFVLCDEFRKPNVLNEMVNRQATSLLLRNFISLFYLTMTKLRCADAFP